MYKKRVTNVTEKRMYVKSLFLNFQALMRRDGPAGFEPYTRPPWFPLRLTALLALVAASLVVASMLTLVRYTMDN